MKRKTQTPKGRQTAAAKTIRVRELRIGPSTEIAEGAAIPLDAEEMVLASLEAKVRAEEAKVDLGTPGAPATLILRLPSAAMAELRAQAAERRVAPSKLAETVLTLFLLQQKDKPRRR